MKKKIFLLILPLSFLKFHSMGQGGEGGGEGGADFVGW